MKHPDSATLIAGLQSLSLMVERNTSKPATLDHPTIVDWELRWREEARQTVAAWLEGEAGALDEAELGKLARCLNLFTREYLDLRSCMTHPDNADRVEVLRQRLRTARDGEDPGVALASVLSVLTDMEQAARDNEIKKYRVVNGIQSKWTVPTALLSLSAGQYPFIRPSNTDPRSGPTPKLLFEGLTWVSSPSAERYAEYCERYARIADAMVSAGLASEPPSLSIASAWEIGLHGLSKEPGEVAALGRLVCQQPTILQGPPGTGKTHRAERLAASLAESDKPTVVPADAFAVGRKGDVVTELVQFHASFDYEDFVRGFRPIATEQGVAFELRDGPFARMVSWALQFPDTEFLLIVDEINRADLARVLGECIYLLDRPVKREDVGAVWQGDKAGAAVLRYPPRTPARSPEDYAPDDGKLLPKLCVPDNFHLVGTMNTADRSIAVVDAALRRRFAFVDVKPDPDVIKSVATKLDKGVVARLQAWMHRLNGDGEGTPGLLSDERYHVGHSYFLGEPAQVEARVRHQLVPLLEEYRRERRFSADDAEVQELLDELRRFPEQ